MSDLVVTFLKVLLLLKYCNCLTRITYPTARRDGTVADNYHGVEIPDPYRHLEELESDETLEFVNNQNALSKQFLDSLPNRAVIMERLTTLVNYERFGAPSKQNGNNYFHFYNSGLQGHDVLIKFINISDPGSSTVILDPNALSEDGSISLYPYYQSYSPDGTKFVYALATKGSDWLSGRLLNVETGEDDSDILQFIKWPEFSFSKWSDGIFYSRFPLRDDEQPITTHAQIYYHTLGKGQNEDIFIYQNYEYPEWFLKAEVSHCGEYLIITPQPDFKSNSILLADLHAFNENITTTIDKFIPVFSALEEGARFIYITNIKHHFIFLSDYTAPNFQLIQIDMDIENGTVGNKTILVGEHSKNILKWVSPVGSDTLLLCYFQDVLHKLELRHASNGSLLQEIQLPFPSVVTDYSTSHQSTEFFFKIENLVNPGLIMRCDCSSETTTTPCPTFECTSWKVMSLPSSIVNMSRYVMEQVFYPSKDGTQIPMFVGHDKDIPLNGENPVLLYGYGGFNVDVLPTFSPFSFTFIQYFEGIYASANIRGGAEYGEPWHASGSLLHKQNSFDDFQHAAMFLIAQNYTKPGKIAIQGSSNGGLLVATCLNQRPDLFGVGLPDVGLMDMLRFQQSPIGFAWCSEYGCSDNATHFNNLIKYSPLHNIDRLQIQEGQFPSVLITTAFNDDRVLPWNSYKYAAELQHAVGQRNTQTNPLLLRVSSNAGHSDEGTPLPQKIEGHADSYAFISYHLQHLANPESNNAPTLHNRLISLFLFLNFITQLLSNIV